MEHFLFWCWHQYEVLWDKQKWNHDWQCCFGDPSLQGNNFPFFPSGDINLHRVGRRKFYLKKITSIILTYRQVCGSIFLTDDWCRKSQALRQCYLWAGCPGGYKRVNGVSQERQANKQHTFFALVSSPASPFILELLLWLQWTKCCCKMK